MAADEGVHLSDKTSVGMPIRNLIGLIGAVCVGAWGYFGILERLNVVETNQILMQADVTKNSIFSTEWPRGSLGSLPADAEQFMLIEDLYKTTEKLEITQEQNMTNKVNIEFLNKQLEKALNDIENLKDKIRANGTH